MVGLERKTKVLKITSVYIEIYEAQFFWVLY